jgi:hypothetical protein
MLMTLKDIETYFEIDEDLEKAIDNLILHNVLSEFVDPETGEVIGYQFTDEARGQREI